MKTPYKLLFPLSLLTIILFLVITGCKKEDDETEIDNYGDPVISTTGEATINQDGGTITIGDATSAIYGASIEIPRDALDENVEIKIIAGPLESIDGQTIQTVEFLPEGLTFAEQVIIGIPWSSLNQSSSNSRIFYLDEENSNIEELEISSVDTENKITYGLSSHFSRFFNRTQYFITNTDLKKSGDQFVAYINLFTPLNTILPRLLDSPYANAEEIILDNDGMQNCFAMLNLNLWKKDNNRENYTELVARQQFYIKYKEEANGWSVFVYRYDNPYYHSNQPVEIFHKSGLRYEDLLDVWLSGFPMVGKFTPECFYDANFTYNASDKFGVSTSWKLVKQINPIYSSQYWSWGYAKYSRLKTFNELTEYSGDDNNNYIVDTYESDNNPPNSPSDPHPQNNEVDASINTDLQWSCSDPNGDDLSYNVYFGTNSNPPYVGTIENATSYSPTGLTENTTYFWYIEAIDPSGLSSISPIWVFMTAEGGGSIGCEGITSVDYEGKSYQTVEIGDQCWFAENLNVGSMINGANDQANNNVIEKYCYNNDEQTCDAYGALYQWDELMQYTNNEGAQGICPSGWHIPSETEWKTLEGTVDSQYGVGDPIWDNTDWRGSDAGDHLKSSSSWFLNGNGSDTYGFAALPGGYRSTSGTFSDQSAGGKFWNSSAGIRMFAFNKDNVLRKFENKSNGYSVRCVKN